ncbi:hypothetical protein CFP65_4677 [Kitasatospora sp. MMS16-BH015]|nr:hypothetical protein CFP65_4677 [Kitasatospora sp. MMS16-BH015]
MTRSFKEFWARFKAANGIGTRSAGYVPSEDLRRQAAPDQHLGEHYRPSGPGGPIVGGGGR